MTKQKKLTKREKLNADMDAAHARLCKGDIFEMIGAMADWEKALQKLRKLNKAETA